MGELGGGDGPHGFKAKVGYRVKRFYDHTIFGWMTNEAPDFNSENWRNPKVKCMEIVAVPDNIRPTKPGTTGYSDYKIAKYQVTLGDGKKINVYSGYGRTSLLPEAGQSIERVYPAQLAVNRYKTPFQKDYLHGEPKLNEGYLYDTVHKRAFDIASAEFVARKYSVDLDGEYDRHRDMGNFWNGQSGELVDPVVFTHRMEFRPFFENRQMQDLCVAAVNAPVRPIQPTQ